MPKFTIRTVNSTFFTEVQPAVGAQADDALAEGVRGALMIAAEEVNGGAAAAVVEVIVDDAAGKQVRRCAVSISVSPLAMGSVPKRFFPKEANDC